MKSLASYCGTALPVDVTPLHANSTSRRNCYLQVTGLVAADAAHPAHPAHPAK